ncbi:MAG TPA: phosphatidate cytidylyltransferase [Caulobacteraceae bacterium]|nr:phosphatidate cytidylyltransferase [Caulobacteraceae bacterium]
MTSLPSARSFDWRNLGQRAVSAVVLIAVVLVAVFYQPLFIVVITLAVVLLAREWARMSAPQAPNRLAVAVAAAVLIAVTCANIGRFPLELWGPFPQAFPLAWALIVPGALATAFAASAMGCRPGDGAFGVVYIAAPAVALSWIRAQPNPISWTILLFAVVWSADICAFLVGNALKGPKLWPRYSPNKTWSGFVGGLVGAMGAAMATAELSTARLTLLAAALIGLAGGASTMAGDLWESILKRRYGVKDSGDLIPGHGGLLDRVDGLMVAVLAIAGARYIHQSGWVH